MRFLLDKRVLVPLVAAEIFSAVLAWRDLARRSDKEVRGSKLAWRVLVSANPGNSMLYWAFGRRSSK
ncbi:MAG TPA: hypothetical protein VFJ19_03830 [Nocardioidaceae bacterium]|nr:hypothetical protein [Nocardioidaceae bacterium]